MDRITKVNKLFHEITSMLPMIYDINCEVEEIGFVTNPDEDAIISADNDVEAIANLFDQLYGEGTCVTGIYGETNFGADAYTGLYYVSIAWKEKKND